MLGRDGGEGKRKVRKTGEQTNRLRNRLQGGVVCGWAECNASNLRQTGALSLYFSLVFLPIDDLCTFLKCFSIVKIWLHVVLYNLFSDVGWYLTLTWLLEQVLRTGRISVVE